MPQTEEEHEIAEEEAKIYVSGDVTFMKDDPGRQAIGSFNPVTDDDWTEMAYVGNTQELCQRICDGDLKFVHAWCNDNPEGLDRRDHTGRTPLHLASECSSPEIVKCLVDHGARIVARLVDGTTALHIAATRGSVEMVTILLEKSEANEAEEAEREDKKKLEKNRQSQSAGKASEDGDVRMDDDDEDDSDEVMEDSSSESDTAMTEGSFVKVADKKGSDEDALDGGDESEPDIYDVNVLAWDTPVSPLHLAILGGHTGVIKTLIGTFGADVLLPIKVVNEYNRSPQAAIMTLVLAARLANPDALSVTQNLLSHGASSAQADIDRVSAFHYVVAKKRVNLLKACIREDAAAAKSALNHLVVEDTYWQPKTDCPLTTAIRSGDVELVQSLLDAGAKPMIELDDYASTDQTMKERRRHSYYREDDVQKMWKENVLQPTLLAVENEMPEIVLKLVEAGADTNTLDKDAHQALANIKDNNGTHLHGKSLLEMVQDKIESLGKTMARKFDLPRHDPISLQKDEYYLKDTEPGSYSRWTLSKFIEGTKSNLQDWKDSRDQQLKAEANRKGKEERLIALEALKSRYMHLHKELRKRGAKSLEELHPDLSRRKHDHSDKSDSTKPKAFDPQVKFEVSASDEVLDGYLRL